ncbi:adaptin N terminal region-domain-containing protein [Mycena metata]|uniref:Adaptin N terminal region-domain-containing protein n=1 Tax=Mycena metata TaxID=1033252 RepID=A0AAD7JWD2_9AGAR|nr:adaptin N terminal region-domain-containing protein [Mycena metata]
MSAVYLNTLSENASRLGMRIQESLAEHSRDLTIKTSSSLYLEPDDKGKNIRKQLDSSSDREKLDAMKRLVALISKGRNVSEYFAQVVKNVASQNLEIRKLVYIYLLRYAEQEPDLALLSINTFQKDLTDSNPLIRAMALRVLSGIKVPMIGSIVVLAIKKCAADMSPYVRKAAALAIPKCYELDASHLPALIGIIATLLRDRSPLSIGSVAVAFEAVCPTRLDMLHQQYRRLCRILVDVDEWGQIDLLNLLLRYARTMLPRPVQEEIDSDVKFLLTSAEPLFQSRNPAVVLAVTRVFYYAGPSSYHPRMVQPLLRLLHTSKEVERVVVAYVLAVSRSAPNLFSPFYPQFLLRTDDLRHVKQDKIKVLLVLANFDTHQAILREFIDCADDPDDEVVSDAIRAIGKCAHSIPDCTQQCLTALITMIKNQRDAVVSSAVMVLKYLVQSQLSASSSSSFAAVAATPQQSPLTIISHLARRIDDIRHAQARACVLWLVGQYSASNEPSSGPPGVVEWAPDVLRKSAKGFASEPSMVKLQIITLAAKLLVLCPSDRTLCLISGYVFSLAKYDLNYDVRDRARMLLGLLSGLGLSEAVGTKDPDQDSRGGVILRREQVRLVLFEGKIGVVDAEEELDLNVALGSLGMITRKPMHGDSSLPDWLERGVESSLRDTEDDAPAPPPPMNFSSSAPLPQRSKGLASPVVLTPSGGSPTGASKPQWTDLDKFYDDEDDEEEDDSESEEEAEQVEQVEAENPAESEEGSEDDEDSDSSDEDDSSHPGHR